MRQAAEHHGIFTAAAWYAAGLSSIQLTREVRRGSVERVHPTAYRVLGAPPTWRSSVMAAVASAGAFALASHRTAPALWQLAGSTGRIIEISTPRHDRVRRRGVRVHESVDLPATDYWVIDGIPVTGINRTLLDSARYLPAQLVGDFVDDAVRRDLTSYMELARWLAVTARRGVRGVRRLRQVLAERPGGTVPPGSTFESRMLDLVRDFVLPTPERQVPVRTSEGTFHIDFGWPSAKVGVEADGTEHHTLTSQHEYDLRRQNLIQLEGWFLLRYTPTALRTRRHVCADQMRAAIQARAGVA